MTLNVAPSIVSNLVRTSCAFSTDLSISPGVKSSKYSEGFLPPNAEPQANEATTLKDPSAPIALAPISAIVGNTI